MSRGGPSPLATPAIERIWIEAARRLGFRVVRTDAAYASSDGRGSISIGASESLDADDAVAQLVFHELCHALCEGSPGLATPDWGLDNTGSGDVLREHACLRLQAHLADPHGLRHLMAPTTEYRAYHDALPVAVLAPDEADPAVAPAREAATRAVGAWKTWGEAIDEALRRTAERVLAGALHPVGFAWGSERQTCGGCAWRFVGGRGRPVERCWQAAGKRTSSTLRACDRWEGSLDCHTCGACCREAYHSVTVSVSDPVVRREPALVVRTGRRLEILREGSRCAALAGSGRPEDLYTCRIYDDRPRTCRDFARGGRHCLEARRRVGLGA